MRKDRLSRLVFKEQVQLCLALLVAGLLSDIASKEGWRSIGKAFRLWWTDIAKGERVSDEEAAKRLAVCKACPLWFKPLQTCGSKLNWKDANLGCGCFMPLKTKLRGAHCWLDEEGITDVPYGWHKHGL